MKRFLTDLFLVFLGIAVIGLFGCAEPAPLEPEPYVPVEGCNPAWSACPDSTPRAPCLDRIPPCRIMPRPPEE